MPSQHPSQFRLFVSILLSGFLFSSCSDSDSDNTEESAVESVVGTQTESGTGTVMDEGSEPVTAADDESSENNPGPIAVTILEAGVEGGPELTSDSISDAGIHLRRFQAWSDAEQARADLSAASFSDGGDRSSLADILVREGGTIVALYPGLQSSSGVVDANIELVEINDERMTVTIRTQVAGSCTADSALAAPFRILHVAAISPRIFFRESIHECFEEGDIEPSRIGQITVDFPDDTTARIDWVPPIDADDQTRYDVTRSRSEADPIDSTAEPTHTISDLVPGVIYTRRIVPVNANEETLSRGTSIALMVDAPASTFRGRATRNDLEALMTRLVGNDLRDCGEFFAILDDDETATEVVECFSEALEENIAFTAERVLIGEATSYQLLIGDGDGNNWVLMLDNSDVLLENDFAPSTFSGGSLAGRSCMFPQILIENNRTQFSC